MRTTLATCTAIPALAFVALQTTPAMAGVTWQWAQDTSMSGQGAGCAHEIAVGPNDVPWVIGCSPTSSSVADKWVYYFSPGTVCGSGICLPTSTWTYAGASGTRISVDLVGDALLVGSNGHISWVKEGTNGGVGWPAGGFSDLTSNSGWPDLGGFVTDAVDLWHGPLSEELFRTGPAPAGDDDFKYADFWANGSGSASTCNGIYRYDLNSGDKGWSSPQAGSCGVKIALFTEPSNAKMPHNESTQTPWSLSQVHDIFAWDQAHSGFALMPGAALDITDHYIVGTDNNVYQWNGTSWDFFLGWSPAGKPIVRVAHAPSVYLTNGSTVGPSHLWAVDSAGNIWYAYQASTAP
jgi:hypothetical protein